MAADKGKVSRGNKKRCHCEGRSDVAISWVLAVSLRGLPRQCAHWLAMTAFLMLFLALHVAGLDHGRLGIHRLPGDGLLFFLFHRNSPFLSQYSRESKVHAANLQGEDQTQQQVAGAQGLPGLADPDVKLPQLGFCQGVLAEAGLFRQGQQGFRFR